VCDCEIDPGMTQQRKKRLKVPGTGMKGKAKKEAFEKERRVFFWWMFFFWSNSEKKEKREKIAFRDFGGFRDCSFLGRDKMAAVNG